jgi:DNA-binding XRE family transcriptional regulator
MAITPFAKFGSQLKRIRRQAKESIAEVSGAVEIDTKALTSIEAGKTQPAADIVLLLISHFALQDNEALKLWELAGYGQARAGLIGVLADEKAVMQTAYVSLQDARILYTDIVHVNANKYGVVINFLQSLGGNSQSMAVSRIGMSHEHAKSLLIALQKTLQLTKDQLIEDTDSQD